MKKLLFISTFFLLSLTVEARLGPACPTSSTNVTRNAQRWVDYRQWFVDNIHKPRYTKLLKSKRKLYKEFQSCLNKMKESSISDLQKYSIMSCTENISKFLEGIQKGYNLSSESYRNMAKIPDIFSPSLPGDSPAIQQKEDLAKVMVKDLNFGAQACGFEAILSSGMQLLCAGTLDSYQNL